MCPKEENPCSSCLNLHGSDLFPSMHDPAWVGVALEGKPVVAAAEMERTALCRSVTVRVLSMLLTCQPGPYSVFISLLHRWHTWWDKICPRFGFLPVNSVTCFKAESQLIIILKITTQFLNTESSVLLLHSPHKNWGPEILGAFPSPARNWTQLFRSRTGLWLC